MKQFIFKWISIFIGGILGYIIGISILYDLLIPNPCYYHNSSTGSWFINLLFDMNSINNFHPEPNLLYILICVFSGGSIGYKIFISLFDKYKVQ